MKTKAKLTNVSFNLKGEILATFEIADKQEFLKEHQNLELIELDLEIKKHRRHRSLNANAYCWAMINELGNVLSMSKEDVYLMMLKRYGQSEMVSILSNINVSGYFKYYDVIGSTILNGKEFTHYRIYKGSSEYDTKEMSILIDGIVQECKEQNIQTMTPQELEMLKCAWKQ